MQERRQAPRTRVLKAAKVIFNEHRSVIDCTVRNLSNSGACLQVSSPVGFPRSSS